MTKLQSGIRIKGLRTSSKTSARKPRNPAKIETEHIPSTSLQRQCYSTISVQLVNFIGSSIAKIITADTGYQSFISVM
jgi:hypothetical protein